MCEVPSGLSELIRVAQVDVGFQRARALDGLGRAGQAAAADEGLGAELLEDEGGLSSH